MHPHLEELRTYLEGKLGIAQVHANSLGIKLWVLPPSYYAYVYREAAWRLAWTDLISLTLNRYQLVCVGDLPGGEIRQAGKTRWTIGKGLLGEAIFTPLPGDTVFALIHGQEWPVDMETMSKRSFRQVARTKRRGMTQDDIVRLRSTYGSAVAVPLRIPQSQYAFGCITAHVPYGQELQAQQLKTCSVILTRAVPFMAAAVVHDLHYRPLKDLIDFTRLAADD